MLALASLELGMYSVPATNGPEWARQAKGEFYLLLLQRLLLCFGLVDVHILLCDFHGHVAITTGILSAHITTCQPARGWWRCSQDVELRQRAGATHCSGCSGCRYMLGAGLVPVTPSV